MRFSDQMISRREVVPFSNPITDRVWNYMRSKESLYSTISQTSPIIVEKMYGQYGISHVVLSHSTEQLGADLFLRFLDDVYFDRKGMRIFWSPNCPDQWKTFLSWFSEELFTVNGFPVFFNETDYTLFKTLVDSPNNPLIDQDRLVIDRIRL